MLEDPSFRHAIAWCPGGDSFDIKVSTSDQMIWKLVSFVEQDINEFTNVLLPRMFNHSNFASFVRQLNKYNFHKMRTYDDVFAEPVSQIVHLVAYTKMLMCFTCAVRDVHIGIRIFELGALISLSNSDAKRQRNRNTTATTTTITNTPTPREARVHLQAHHRSRVSKHKSRL